MKTKSVKEKRTLTIEFRVTQAEFNKVEENAKKAGKPRATYAREMSLMDIDLVERAEMRADLCAFVTSCKQEIICAYREIEDTTRTIMRHADVSQDLIAEMKQELRALSKARENLTKGVSRLWQ